MVTTNYNGIKITAPTAKGVVKIITCLQEQEMKDDYEEDMHFTAYIMAQISVYAKERNMDYKETVKQLCANILFLLDYMEDNNE